MRDLPPSLGMRVRVPMGCLLSPQDQSERDMAWVKKVGDDQ